MFGVFFPLLADPFFLALLGAAFGVPLGFFFWLLLLLLLLLLFTTLLAFFLCFFAFEVDGCEKKNIFNLASNPEIIPGHEGLNH